MPLIDDVKKLTAGLKEHNWQPVFQPHGLDLGAADLAAELNRPLPVDRTQPGFEDFAAAGSRAIEPGQPARSLLYHALASPLVHPRPLPGHSQLAAGQYPTLDELDTLENYIFSVAKPKLAQLFPKNKPTIAVLAYQYRTAPFTTHGEHADLVFSRTGIGRVGTRPASYDRARRGFWPVGADKRGIRVMPARFAAFFVEPRLGEDNADHILRSRPLDNDLKFLFPRHKIFAGNECLDGESIESLEFLEYHINEKLRRIHWRSADNPGAIPLFPGFDLNKYPFVRESDAGQDPLVRLERHGGSVLVLPIEHDELVRTAQQHNAKQGVNEIVRFVVPPRGLTDGNGSQNRYESSLAIPPGPHGQAAPEYVNIRHRVNRADNGHLTLEDVNLLPRRRFEKLLTEGGYEAAHFMDDSCEGAVRAVVKGLSAEVTDHAAYSLVGAPHFFPLIMQVDVQRWYETTLNATGYFRKSQPRPLSDGRFNDDFTGLSNRRPNPALRLPGDRKIPAFPFGQPVNQTVTAVVGLPGAKHPVPQPANGATNFAPSYLPDAGADVFAPGWDISLHGDEHGDFYAAYGLGSPFPEDAKLCAALNSFWPAAAPDAGRTFRSRLVPDLIQLGTSMPLLDDELGFHPQHPRVLAGMAHSQPGWDGNFGPFLQFVAGELFVNFASIMRSDYVSQAWDERITIAGLVNITTTAMIARMDALRAAIARLDAGGDVADTAWWLIGADAVQDWSHRSDRVQPSMTGPGFSLLFAWVWDKPRPSDELSRLRWPVARHLVCQTWTSGGAIQVELLPHQMQSPVA